MTAPDPTAGERAGPPWAPIPATGRPSARLAGRGGEGVVIRSIAASTGTSEDVEALLDRVDWMDLWWQMTGDDWPVPDSFPREFAKIVVARLGLAAREAAARAAERERIAQAIEALSGNHVRKDRAARIARVARP